MNTARHLLLAGLLALGGTGAHALGMDIGYERFQTADAVTWVQTCGTWGRDHQGTYRVVHAEAYGQSFLYVQWMTQGDEKQSYSLQPTHTLAIAELDNDHAEISLSDITCRATPRGIVITAKADSANEEKLRRVMIEVGPAPGQYRYKAQNTR